MEQTEHIQVKLVVEQGRNKKEVVVKHVYILWAEARLLETLTVRIWKFPWDMLVLFII